SYLSVSNGSISTFAQQLETGQFQLIQPLRNGFDDRQIANNFLGVRYILTEKENETYLPYGYEVVEDLSKKSSSFIVAETKDYFPFAYANTTYLTYESFRQLNPVEKEQFLSYGVTVDSKEVDTTDLTLFDQPLKVASEGYQLVSNDQSKASVEEDGIMIKETNSKVELLLDDPAVLQDAEVYVYLEGLDFASSVSDPLTGTSTSFAAGVTLGERKKTIRQPDVLSFSSYIKRSEMLFNIGYQDENSKEETISLQFSEVGKYVVEDITVFVVPLDEDYSNRVAEKRDKQLNIETFTNEKVSGSIAMAEASILSTTIPYTKGWEAEVNGEEVETIRVNEGFIGLPLESGTSTVTFTYQPPFLIMGAWLSLAGSIAFIANHVFWNKY
ncbi:MAG: YfhO family protein, partial [Carnobacterium alterfunditum]